MAIITEKPDYLYRKGVGIMLLNEKKEIFVGKRVRNKSDAWQMPQGGLDSGEDEQIAAFRELEEETGICDVELVLQSSTHFYYDLPYFLQKKFWGGKYLGQKQRWFLMRFTGDEKKINVKTAEPEFSVHKWVDSKILLNSVVPFKKSLYENIINEFKDHII
jgi:putative (di)nucleoside polyphosphate hydrolase